jgi:uncharacterized protein (DUF1778 family)
MYESLTSFQVMAFKFNQEIFKKVMSVFDNIIDQNSSLRKALETQGISVSTFHRYVSEVPECGQAYLRASDIRAHNLVDEIIEISDTELDPQRARNMIDARKWVASKLMPQKYGDRIDVNVTATVDLSAALSDAVKRAKFVVNEAPQQIEVNEDYMRRVTDTESAERESIPEKTSEKLFKALLE